MIWICSFFLLLSQWLQAEEGDLWYDKIFLAKNEEQLVEAANQTLSFYLQTPAPHPVWMDERISRSFFLLGQYGWAILYAQRGLAKEPENAALLALWHEAEQKLELPPSSPLFHWPTAEEVWKYWQWSSFFFLIVAIFWGIGPRTNTWFYLFGLVGMIWFLCVAFLLYSAFGAPVWGVMVRSSPLYLEGKWDAPLTGKEAVLEGMIVQVKEVDSGGRWLLVRHREGKVEGYVSYSVVRIVN